MVHALSRQRGRSDRAAAMKTDRAAGRRLCRGVPAGIRMLPFVSPRRPLARCNATSGESCGAYLSGEGSIFLIYQFV